MKVRRINFSADEWIAGCQGMTEEEEGLYVRLTARIYSRGGPLAIAGLASYCGSDPRKFERLLSRLVAKGKVYMLPGDRGEVGEMLSIHRCDLELKSAQDRIEIGETLAAKRWQNNDVADAAPHMRARNANHQLITNNIENPPTPLSKGGHYGKSSRRNGHVDPYHLEGLSTDELARRFNDKTLTAAEHDAIRQKLSPGSHPPGY